MSEQVECFSSGGYADRPTAFHWRGQRQVVEKLLARWRTPQGLVFRVQTSSGAPFELIYHEIEDSWEIREI